MYEALGGLAYEDSCRRVCHEGVCLSSGKCLNAEILRRKADESSPLEPTK
jgi:hypothetical protein